MDMATICAELQDECEALDRIVSTLDAAGWDTPTPAEGWMVRDQIRHIGSTDRVATLAASDPERFQSEVLGQDRPSRGRRVLQAGRVMGGPELLAWWRTGRGAMIEVFLCLESRARIPWFGPAMSAVSFATARLMETWAHGQDIVDALGLDRSATVRLRHVAHLGVGARPFSYRSNDKEPPTADVRVELVSPLGTMWTWGEEQAGNRVSGAALDFCLVVTQRRHLADTDLRLEGPIAQEWMSMAQAFAGPPGGGRQPGQFPKQR